MATIEGTQGKDKLKGTSNADLIKGYGGADDISGGGGSDTIIGGSGDDTLTGGAGKDLFVIDGREFGEDLITDWTKGDQIDVSALNVGDFNTLRLFLREKDGSTFLETFYSGHDEVLVIQDARINDLQKAFRFNTSADSLKIDGTNSFDVLFGGNGADRLRGLGHTDVLAGGLGDDTLIGGASDDTLTGGGGGDRFVVDAHGFGDDLITDWGAGDVADVAVLKVADLATLSLFMHETDGSTVLDLFYGGGSESITFEGVRLSELKSSDFAFHNSGKNLKVEGTNSYDVLFGGKGNDKLYGYMNTDALAGGAGNDTLIGGASEDTLYGGAGRDQFTFFDGDGSTFSVDWIMDFSHAEKDKIDLSGMDADLTRTGDQAFELHSGSFTKAGQLRVTLDSDHTYLVELNLDNDSSAEVYIMVSSSTMLKNADFIL